MTRNKKESSKTIPTKKKAKTQSTKPSPPEHSRFKSGESGNPGGRPKTDPALAMIKNLTNKELIEIGNLVVKGNIEELKAVQKDPSATVIKTMIAAVCVKVISKGDMNALDTLLNRLVGKVKDETKITGGLNTSIPAQVIVTLPSNNRDSNNRS